MVRTSTIVRGLESGELEELLGVSGVIFETGDEPTSIKVHVSPAGEIGRQKCERCWHWEPVIDGDPAHPSLCPRCVVAIKDCQTS